MNVYYFCFSKDVPISTLKEKQKSTTELTNVKQLFLNRQVFQTDKVFTVESTSYEKATAWIIDTWLPKVQGLLFSKEDITSFLEEGKVLKESTSKNGIHFITNKKSKSDEEKVNVLSIVRCTKNMSLAGRKIDASKWVRTPRYCLYF